MLKYCDTHCHLQFEQYAPDYEGAYDRAMAAGVNYMVTVGTDVADSQKAIDFANHHQGVWASVGLHPHEAKDLEASKKALTRLIKEPKVVAVGECGLDYFYNHSPKELQLLALRFQIELALANNLPLIFHIRDAYDDFWPIVDEYKIERAVAHCFAAGPKELEAILKRSWFVGLNGIATFSKNESQLEAYKLVPLDKLLIETDAPYLTPAPFRGKINEPKSVAVIAEFLSKLRGETLERLVTSSTNNAKRLFGI